MRPIRKVLVANRGEIAVRILHALREMRIASLALRSDADRDALHAQLADDVADLPGESADQTYLNVDRILALCRERGVDAVHPGYGFLAENADFADACAQAGVTFIGPSPQALRTLGDKLLAKSAMATAGVSTIPGWSGHLQTNESEIAQQAQSIGYPILVKAAAGGGGKGMRRVNGPDELTQAWRAAAREAQNAFGDARVFLEKCLDGARHVEVQIFGDAEGGALHLFERDCSIQRRHQKIIEESPCPALSPQTRERMTAAALKAAQAVGYHGAGTVEFLLTPQDDFYFLEVNARLQVEHPVTEAVTGVDLVHAQLLTAQGLPPGFSQETLTTRGHAIECRICAEDPARGFLPVTGEIKVFRPPVIPGVRVDSGVQTGDRVTPHYDSMLAKVIVHAPSRAQALARMRAALDDFVILGVTTNLPLLQAILVDDAFTKGRYDTSFLSHRPDLLSPDGLADHPEDPRLALAAVIAAHAPSAQSSSKRTGGPVSPWRDNEGWRLGATGSQLP
ncbi:MAG: ATP-grasp domain-containing protein [Vampirovibrionales bacterium]|nr:ATP-grasp domain-containing protein [Vampirovibrionales bacterium]